MPNTNDSIIVTCARDGQVQSCSIDCYCKCKLHTGASFLGPVSLVSNFG